MSSKPLPEINHATYVDASIHTVFQTLTTARGWDSWFTEGTEIDLRVGGRITLRWSNFGAGHATTEDGGPIVSLEADKRFAFEWHPGTDPTRVEFILEPKGAGTVVRLTERGYAFDEKDAEACIHCAVGWGEALTLLKMYLEHGVTYGAVPV